MRSAITLAGATDMDALEPLGAFERRDDRIDMRFERHYPRSVERVWSALTEPARLQDWMGAALVEPRVGGRYELMIDGPNPMIGRVLRWESPRVLEFTWSNRHAPDSTARYELSPDGDGTRLIFTHSGAPFANRALMLPGWHHFFDRLHACLGAPTDEPKQSWRELQTVYVGRYAMSDARLDP
ncbi:MAG: SRPBCC family protein [Bradyrhizobium sp.]|nr:MAG: SRPBCC family protein [Bradyrhizobium sp.]